MNCPACGYYNPQGLERCGHCSLPLPLVAQDAFCALHPDVRATGACSRCGTFGCGACLTQRGADWLCPSCSSRAAVLPWDERATLGLWKAWWRTSVALLSSPTQTLSSAEPDAPLGSSLLFALLSMVVGYAPTLLIYSLILIPTMLLGAKSDFPVGGALIPLFAVIYVVLLAGMQIAAVLVLSGLEHLILKLLGPEPKSYSVTVRGHALGTAPYLLGLMPVCGVYVFVVWAVVLRILAHLNLHKTTAGKATLAVLGPIALFCGLVMAFYVAVIGLAVMAKH